MQCWFHGRHEAKALQVKSYMRTIIVKLLALAAALCFGGAVAIEYHADQIAASHVLAQMGKPSTAVAAPTTDPQAGPIEGVVEVLVMPDYSGLQSGLLVAGIVLLSLLTAILFDLVQWRDRRRPARPKNVEAVGSFPSVDMFEPILSQEELMAEQEAERRTSRIISRVASAPNF